jgi:squalene cyclase
VPAMTSYLLAAQAPSGSWSGHWWDDDEYTTARAVEALAGSGAHAEAVRDAASWCSDRVDPDGSVWSAAHGGPSPFATALALHAIRVGGLVTGPPRWGPSAQRAERWLLSQQLDDGSWEPSARLRVPAPAVRDPEAARELTLSYVDDEGAFTTATVLAALSAGRSSAR